MSIQTLSHAGRGAVLCLQIFWRTIWQYALKALKIFGLDKSQSSGYFQGVYFLERGLKGAIWDVRKVQHLDLGGSYRSIYV